MPYKVLTLADVKGIRDEDCPMLVLTDTLAKSRGLWGLFGYAVEAHTHGAYGHAMWMHKPGWFASQDLTFSEIPYDSYVDSNHRVKFVRGTSWDDLGRLRVLSAILARLQRPWYKRLYDPIGIVGQALNIPKINNPYSDFCSESVLRFLKLVEPKAPLDLGYHPSPSDLDRWVREQGPRMEVFGVWDPVLQEGKEQ